MAKMSRFPFFERNGEAKFRNNFRERVPATSSALNLWIGAKARRFQCVNLEAETLSLHLTSERDEVSYAQLAATLGVAETVVKKQMRNLRERYRWLLRNEVAQTVENPDDVNDEDPAFVRYAQRCHSMRKRSTGLGDASADLFRDFTEGAEAWRRRRSDRGHLPPLFPRRGT